MKDPAIKAIAITAVVDDVVRLRDEGRVSPEELEARLEPEDLELLEKGVSSLSWCPIDSYQRMTRLLWDVEGGGAPEYLHQRGALAAQRLVEAGIYQQIEFLDKRYDAKNIRELKHDLNLVVSLQGALLTFGVWSVAVDPDHDDRLQIEVREAGRFPDELCHTTAGFISGLSQTARKSDLRWYFERPRRDFVVFRMDRSPTFSEP